MKLKKKPLHYNLEEVKTRRENGNIWQLSSVFDPLGQPTVSAGSYIIVFAHVVRPSPLFKTKQISSESNVQWQDWRDLAGWIMDDTYLVIIFSSPSDGEMIRGGLIYQNFKVCWCVKILLCRLSWTERILVISQKECQSITVSNKLSQNFSNSINVFAVPSSKRHLHLVSYCVNFVLPNLRVTFQKWLRMQFQCSKFRKYLWHVTVKKVHEWNIFIRNELAVLSAHHFLCWPCVLQGSRKN